MGKIPTVANTVLMLHPPGTMVSGLEEPGSIGTFITVPPWQPNTTYAQNVIVVQNATIYDCSSQHVSASTFAADIGNWTPVFGLGTLSLGPVFNVDDPRYGGSPSASAATNTAAINAAITDLNAAGFGVLHIPGGTHVTNGGHQVNVPCIIRGQGYGTIGAGNGVSVLSLANGANADLLTLSAKAITVQDLGLYGNIGGQSGTSRGLVTSLTTACNYFRLNRVWIDSFHDDGLFLQGPGSSLEGMATHCKVTNNGAHGIRLDSGAAADCQFLHVVSNSNVLSGAYVNSTDAVFTDCHMWGNGSSTSPPTSGDVSGLFMPSGAGGALRITGGYYESNGNSTAGGRGITPRGTGNQIIGAHIYNNRAQGVYAFSNTSMVISGCVVKNNNLNNGTLAVGAGIEYDTCTTCSVVGCQMFDTQGTKTQTYGYAENANTCNACLFDGNISRAADNKTGNWLVGTGNPTATAVGTNVA